MCKINSLKYYECAIIGTSQVFTYQSTKKFNTFDIVLTPLKNTQKEALILKETNKPNYKCKDIKRVIKDRNYSILNSAVEF